jgi:hypothetical protein
MQRMLFFATVGGSLAVCVCLLSFACDWWSPFFAVCNLLRLRGIDCHYCCWIGDAYDATDNNLQRGRCPPVLHFYGQYHGGNVHGNDGRVVLTMRAARRRPRQRWRPQHR